ncbi:TetR/AcrR family transcriptional regulator [bacterium]|nr:TetR/AcrR family transcriptional regulator [bacterium]
MSKSKVKTAKSVKSPRKPKKARDYNNDKRSEKSNLNRQKIIELYVNLLVEANGQDVPLQMLAKKSKTSMRTLFRFFGDKESLNNEIDNYLGQYLSSVSDNLNKMKFEEYSEYSFKVFDQYEKLFKAYLYTNFGQKSRLLFRKKFNDLLVQKVSHEIGINPNPEELMKIYFVVSLVNANIWKDIKDSFEVSGTDISATIRWATETLLSNIKSQKAP